MGQLTKLYNYGMVWREVYYWLVEGGLVPDLARWEWWVMWLVG